MATQYDKYLEGFNKAWAEEAKKIYEAGVKKAAWADISNFEKAYKDAQTWFNTPKAPKPTQEQIDNSYKEEKIAWDKSGLVTNVPKKEEPVISPIMNRATEDSSIKENAIADIKNMQEDNKWLTSTTPQAEVKLKPIEDKDFSSEFKTAFERGIESGKSVEEVKKQLSSYFAKQWYDVASLEKQYAPIVEQYASLDRTADDFYSSMLAWEEIADSKWLSKNSTDYQVAEARMKVFQSLPKDLSKLADLKLTDEQIASLPKETLAEVNRIKAERGTILDDIDSITDAVTSGKWIASELWFSTNTETESSYIEKLSKTKSVLDEEKAYYDNLRQEYRNVENSVNNNPKYKDMPQWAKNAIIRREKAAIQKKMDSSVESLAVHKTAYDIDNAEWKTLQDVQYRNNRTRVEMFNKTFSVWQKEKELVDKLDYEQKLEEIKNDWALASEFAFQNLWSGVIVRTNKKTGEYEFIDINNIPAWEDVIAANWVTINDNGIDFSTSKDLVAKYPWVAWFKNNNLTWITYQAASNELKKIWSEAWIDFKEWTARPEEEGGNYVKFGTIQDWLEAYKIALTERGDDVYLRLKAWVGWDEETKKKYADDLMWEAWIDRGEQFSELDDERLNRLMIAQLRKESPWMLEEMKKAWIIDGNNINLEAGKTSSWWTTTENVQWGTVQDLMNRTSKEYAITQLWQAAFGWGRAFSNEDYKNAERMLEANPNMSIIEFKDGVRWYQIFTGDKKLWDVLKDKLKWAWVKDFNSLSDFINEENYNQAIRDVETQIIDSVEPENKIRENKISLINKRTNELLDLISEWEDVVWPMEWTLEVFLWRLQEEEATAIENRIQALISKQRNEIAWVAMSDRELEIIRPLFPNITMRKDALIDATEQVKVRGIDELNTFRNSLWLPSLSENMIGSINLENRIDLYKWWQKENNNNETVVNVWWFKINLKDNNGLWEEANNQLDSIFN